MGGARAWRRRRWSSAACVGGEERALTAGSLAQPSELVENRGELVRALEHREMASGELDRLRVELGSHPPLPRRLEDLVFGGVDERNRRRPIAGRVITSRGREWSQASGELVGCGRREVRIQRLGRDLRIPGGCPVGPLRRKRNPAAEWLGCVRRRLEEAEPPAQMYGQRRRSRGLRGVVRRSRPSSGRPRRPARRSDRALPPRVGSGPRNRRSGRRREARAPGSCVRARGVARRAASSTRRRATRREAGR